MKGTIVSVTLLVAVAAAGLLLANCSGKEDTDTPASSTTGAPSDGTTTKAPPAGSGMQAHTGSGMEMGGVALDGYCPVAYHKMGKAVKGKAEFHAEYNGKTYYFVKAMARDLFKKNPTAFLPVDSGSCIVCTANGKKGVAGDPTVFSIHEKKLYLFASVAQKKMFDADPDMYLKSK